MATGTMKKETTLKDEYNGRWLKYRGIIFSSDGALLITPSALGSPSRVVNYADTAVIVGVGGATVQGMSISDNGAFVQASFGSYRGIMTIGATLEWD